MRLSRFLHLPLVLFAAAPACASRDDASQTRSDLASDDAVLEADLVETVDLTTDDVDADDDPPSVDDDDAPAEPELLADLPLDAPLPEAGAGTYENPLLPSCADPGVTRVDPSAPTFYVACTGGLYARYASPDLVHWTSDGHIFSPATRPGWASQSFWAPEIHRIGSGYVAYFAAHSTRRDAFCIGAARADSPEGPFADIGRPLVCGRTRGFIDPNVVTDANGRHYLYYKTTNAPNEPTIIYGHELDASGVGFVGNRFALIESGLAWEHGVVEGPWVHARAGRFYMFYSGATYCNDTYAVGVARAGSPLGRFVKHGAPILRSNAEWIGPGHNSIVRTGGRDWIVYHAYKGAHACSDTTGARELLLDRVRWVGGWPRINNGTPSRGPKPAPTVP